MDELGEALKRSMPENEAEQITAALRSAGQHELAYVDFLAATMSLQEVASYDRLWNIFYQYLRSITEGEGDLKEVGRRTSGTPPFSIASMPILRFTFRWKALDGISEVCTILQIS